jgi:hypothetical protein
MPREMTFLVQVRLNADTPVNTRQLVEFANELSESSRAWLNLFTDTPTSARVDVHPFWTPDQAAAVVDSMLR